MSDINYCYECGQLQGCIGGNGLNLSRHLKSCSYARVPVLDGCEKPRCTKPLCAATGLHVYTDDITIMRKLRDVYLTATYQERNRLINKQIAKETNLRNDQPPFSVPALINEVERAFADLTGRERRWRDVFDEACHTGDYCNHCDRRRNHDGLMGASSHTRACPHWNGGTC